jgi:hypothetical protein
MILDETAPIAAGGWELQSAEVLWRSKAGNSLLERSGTPLVCEFPGGYVIRPGMRRQTAGQM